MLHVEMIYTEPSSLRWLWYQGLDSVLRGPPKSQPTRSMPESIQHLNVSPFYCRGGGEPNTDATKIISLFHKKSRVNASIVSLGNTIKTSRSTVTNLQNLTHAFSPANALSHLSPAGQHPPTGTKIAVTAGHHLCLENPTAPSLLTSYPFLFVKSSLNSVPTICTMAPALL